MTRSSSWQSELANCITNPEELFELLALDKTLLEGAKRAAENFPLRVPRGFVARMQKGNPNDPLLRQVLPLGIELEKTPGFETDPLQELNCNPIPGLLHKYHGRVLLTLTGVCGVNCRFCFRRHFPYTENNPGTFGWERALDYIQNDVTLREVILSGGDPLIATDKTLQTLAEKLATISHLTTLRIHSRMPVVMPSRITEEFLAWFSGTRLKPVLVMHANHPQEISAEVYAAAQTLRQANVVLFNQAVLLKNVNDHAETLIALSEKLFSAGILPYYLHVLDKVSGAHHFDLALTEARRLHAEIAAHLPGYLVPKLVCEKFGAPGKVHLYES